MQVCLFNSTNVPIYVSEIGMTVGVKQKSRVLTESERVAIVNDYLGLRFVDVLMEEKSTAKHTKIETEIEDQKAQIEEEPKAKRKSPPR
jgi:hypothetical protein